MNIQQVKDLIAAADVCGHVPLIKGKHGIGKSESVAQYAKEQNMHYEPLILSLMDTGDLLGMPDTKKVSGVTSTLWAAPSWFTNILNAAWPEDTSLKDLQFIDTDFQEYVISNLGVDTLNRELLNNLYCTYYQVPNDRLQLSRQNNVRNIRSRRSVLNLDEFNRAPPDILNASLQLILEHKLHSHELPLVEGRETLIVAAVNPSNGNYTVQEFDPALLDRFVECEAEADLSNWVSNYALKRNLNQVVVDFLMVNKNKFHFEPEDGSKGASPRSWTRLANYMDLLKSTPEDVMSHYIKGTVGTSLAAQFLQFYTSNKGSLSYKKIETFIKQQIKSSKTFDIEKVSATVGTKITGLEAMAKLNYADTFLSEYFKVKDSDTNLPALVYLYALPLENLASVLKRIQKDDPKVYAEIAKLDKKHNNKGLFLKLVSLKKE
jgi:MoxR-like ATPase